jgi:SOS-response transcriptional repressor LexA
MMIESRPSKKQRELLSFIDGFIKGNGYGPSYREIMRALDYKSVSTVAVHVDGLIKRGFLYKKDHSARSLEVVKDPISSATSQDVDKQAYYAWFIGYVELKLTQYERPDDETGRDDVAILIESLRIMGLKKEHATLRERFDSYQNKQ